MSTSSPDTQNDPGSPDSKKRKMSAGRTSQACTRCRSLKMKCIGANDPPCRRCRRTGASCDFVPRANAARPWSPGPYPSHTCTELWRTEVNARLKSLEATNARLEALVIQLQGGSSTSSRPPTSIPSQATGLELDLMPRSPDHSSDRRQYHGVLSALERLKNELPAHLARDEAWMPPTVRKYWESFRSHMPGLHFFSGQVSFVHPTPLLAVAILYVAAAHYPSADVARHQPVYFQALTRAIGTLAMPDSPLRGTCTTGEDGELVSAKFDDVLGIILVGLLAVGWVDTVGMWVNTAYRLLLDGMAEERGRRQSEWLGLWEGLRTIELEHSSLHLICPALPRTPPNPPFTQSAPEPSTAGGSIGEVLAIMQRRMPRFVGRGLPTMWETVCAADTKPMTTIATGLDDMDAIQAWAAEIDAWYQRSAQETANSSLYVRTIILLNYHLHKLFVLSIFFPLRGISYTSASQRDELLASSRVVLKIESSGFEVWSSWDLVMITNASLVLLQAWATGAANTDDLNLIQNHLNILTCTHQSTPSLRGTLCNRLETALQQVRTPVRPMRTLPTVSPQTSMRPSSNELVDSWSFQHTPNSGQSSQLHQHQHSQPQHIPQRGGYLFTDQAPDLNILPNLPTFDLSDTTNVADWPPFLLNLFGYGDGQQPPQPQGY